MIGNPIRFWLRCELAIVGKVWFCIQ
jgi:hypothetical protein